MVETRDKNTPQKTPQIFGFFFYFSFPFHQLNFLRHSCSNIFLWYGIAMKAAEKVAKKRMSNAPCLLILNFYSNGFSFQDTVFIESLYVQTSFGLPHFYKHVREFDNKALTIPFAMFKRPKYTRCIKFTIGF